MQIYMFLDRGDGDGVDDTCAVWVSVQPQAALANADALDRDSAPFPSRRTPRIFDRRTARFVSLQQAQRKRRLQIGAVSSWAGCA